jgi:hypothetical protein
MSSIPAPVVEKVTRTRVVSSAELAQEKPGRTTPEFWEFIEKMTPQMWGDDFTLYILREDPKPSLYGGTNTLEKCPGYIAMPDGTKQPLSSREDIELAIRQKYGGKAFRLILKRGNGERISEGKCINESQPKYPHDMVNPLPQATATDASVASKAIDAMASQQPDALRLSMEVLRSASEIVMRHQTQPNPVPSADSELDRAFKQAMIQKLLAPPPDPVETFLRIKQAIGDNGGGSLAGNPLMDRVLTAAVDKILNPLPAITGRTTLLDIGREFIPVLGTVMHEYRLSREADARITEIQRSAMPPQPMQTVQPNPPAVTQLPAAQPTAQAAPNPPPVPAPSLTFQQIENHIAKIVKNVDYPVDEAVDKVLEFLYDTDPHIVGALLNPPSLDARLKPGKEGLMMLFNAEPELQPCLVNLPRLSEFLDKFIVAATEEEANQMRLRAAAPANAAAPPPA